MANIPDKFPDCLEAVDDKLNQQRPEVQENVKLVELENEVVQGTSDQHNRARTAPKSNLRMADGTINSERQTADDVLLENQKKIDALELRLVKQQAEINEEKHLRLSQDEKLTELLTRLNLQTRLILSLDEKLTELQTKVKEERQLRLSQDEKLAELQTKLNEETQIRMNQDEKLTGLQTRVNKEKQLKMSQDEKLTELQAKLNEESQVSQGEKLIQLRTKLNKETQLRLRQEAKLTELQERLNQETQITREQDEKRTELQTKVNKETQLRLSQLEERCAGLNNTLEQIKQQPEQYEGAAQKKMPQLTAAEQKKYGQQLLDACGLVAGKRNIRKVRELLSLGVECNVRHRSNSTPLHYAAACGHADICQLLLDAAPALVNACDNTNDTPLQAATRWGRLNVVVLLTQHGADHTHRDVDGQSALDLAVKYNHHEVAHYLRRL